MGGITEQEWQHRREVALTCSTWKELKIKLGLIPKLHFQQRLHWSKHNVVLGLPRQATHLLPEEEWERRRQIALTATSWKDLSRKLGILTVIKTYKQHGVFILCNKCKKVPYTKILTLDRWHNKANGTFLLCESCYNIKLGESLKLLLKF
jgi:hypothetical protein